MKVRVEYIVSVDLEVEANTKEEAIEKAKLQALKDLEEIGISSRHIWGVTVLH